MDFTHNIIMENYYRLDSRGENNIYKKIYDKANKSCSNAFYPLGLQRAK